MAALTAEFNNPSLLKVRGPLTALVKAATKIYQGSLVCLDATGYAVPGSATTGLTHLGIAEKTVDNSLGASGDLSIEVDQCAGVFDNSGGDLVVQADMGLDVYITDDHTVCHTSTGKSIAGKFLGFDKQSGKPMVYAGAL